MVQRQKIQADFSLPVVPFKRFGNRQDPMRLPEPCRLSSSGRERREGEASSSCNAVARRKRSTPCSHGQTHGAECPEGGACEAVAGTRAIAEVRASGQETMDNGEPTITNRIFMAGCRQHVVSIEGEGPQSRAVHFSISDIF